LKKIYIKLYSFNPDNFKERTMATVFETGHVGLNVSNLTRSTQFYQQVFGFEVFSESHEHDRHFAGLGLNRTLLITLWEQSQGHFEKARPGLHHLSFKVDTLEELERAEQRVRAAGAKFLYEGIVAHSEGAKSGGIFFEDPDGIRLEIFSPTGGVEKTAPVADAPSCGFF
jgi:catechol-2,3-dioxygenase